MIHNFEVSTRPNNCIRLSHIVTENWFYVIVDKNGQKS